METNSDNIYYTILYIYPSNNRPGYEVALDTYRLITTDATLTIVLQVHEGKSGVYGSSKQQRSQKFFTKVCDTVPTLGI